MPTMSQATVTDGHLFVANAVENGAALLIVERELDTPAAQIVVSDGYDALASLAREVVARVRARGTLSVVAVTGSNGKTTTKNMLRAVLEGEGPTATFTFEGQQIPVTISIGVADMTAEITDPAQFIKSADARLYQAKHEGRNRVCG